MTALRQPTASSVQKPYSIQVCGTVDPSEPSVTSRNDRAPGWTWSVLDRVRLDAADAAFRAVAVTIAGAGGRLRADLDVEMLLKQNSGLSEVLSPNSPVIFTP
jgi:hypothetical protein